MAQSDVSAHADHFAALGHGDRLAALDAIFEADDDPVAFSTIRDHTTFSDPGRLAYHLRQLEPTFVDHSSDGYELTRRGWNAARTIRLGLFDTDERSATHDVDGDCVRCGGDLRLGYDDRSAAVACRDCDAWFVRYLVSPGGIADRDPAGVQTLLDHRCRALRRAGNRGVCHLCAGVADRRLVAGTGPYGHPAHVAYDCDRCKVSFTSTLGAAHAAHPELVAFATDHGIDVTRPLWELAFAFDADAVEVLDADEPRATLALAADGDSVELTVGAGGGVVAVDHA